MNDQQKFLDALARNEDDNVTRLVYADWLDEHDQPEEANRMRTWQTAKKWLSDFAVSLGSTDSIDDEGYCGLYREITYADVIEAGRNWLNGSYETWDNKPTWEGDYFTQIGSETARTVMSDADTRKQFWHHWQIVTGVRVEEGKQGVVFSCSC